MKILRIFGILKEFLAFCKNVAIQQASGEK
jgi:hypothetical protein